MVFHRFRRYLRRRPRRPSFRRFAKKVRSVIRKTSESKYVSQYPTTNFSSVSTSWSEANFVSISQGDDVFAQRQGRRIAVTGFYLNGTIHGGQSNLATDDRTNSVRIVGTVSTNATPMASAGPGLSDMITPRATAGVLLKWMDKHIILQSPSGDSTGYMPAIKTVKYYHKFKKPVIIDYSGTTSGTWNKAVCLSMISDSSVVSHPGFVNGQVRLIYKDI